MIKCLLASQLTSLDVFLHALSLFTYQRRGTDLSVVCVCEHACWMFTVKFQKWCMPHHECFNWQYIIWRNRRPHCKCEMLPQRSERGGCWVRRWQGRSGWGRWGFTRHGADWHIYCMCVEGFFKPSHLMNMHFTVKILQDLWFFFHFIKMQETVP